MADQNMAEWWLWVVLALAIVVPAAVGLWYLHRRESRFRIDETDRAGA